MCAERNSGWLFMKIVKRGFGWLGWLFIEIGPRRFGRLMCTVLVTLHFKYTQKWRVKMGSTYYSTWDFTFIRRTWPGWPRFQILCHYIEMTDQRGGTPCNPAFPESAGWPGDWWHVSIVAASYISDSKLTNYGRFCALRIWTSRSCSNCSS